MLVGFLVVAALQLALVVVPVLMVLAVLPHSVALQAGVPLFGATAGVFGYATWRALRLRRSEPAGVPVSRADAPRLWAMLDDAAAIARTRPPDTVTVVAEAAATLSERTRLLGIIGGRRDLYLGLPLLQAFDVAQLRAVVMHEVAHASPRLGRLAPMAYRGRVAVCRTVPRIHPRNPAGLLLRAYATLYRRVDAPVTRQQELAADALAARFAGARAAAAVLRDVPLVEAAQRLFYAEYLGPGWQAGHVPDDIFGGFLRVLAARAEELTAARSRELSAVPSVWDTHPPVAERLAAIAASSAASSAAPPSAAAPDLLPSAAGSVPQPPTAGPAADGSKESPGASGAAAPGRVATDGAASGGAAAGVAVAGGAASGTAAAGGAVAGSAATGGAGAADAAAGVGRGAGEGGADGDGGAGAAGDLVPDLPGLGRVLQRIAFPPQGRTTVGWDEFFGAARTAEMQREADAALTALSRAAGTPVNHAGEVLDLAADGRLLKAAESVFPELSAEATAQRVTELVTLLLALASLRCGAARWRHSWTGTAELVAPDGSPFDVGEVAARAVAPDTGAARELAARLGIDLTAAGQVGSTRTATRAEVIGGLVNVVVDGARSDLLILDTGLLVVPGVARSQTGTAKRRLAGLAAAAEPERQATVAGSRFVAYEDISGAAQTRRTPRCWELGLHDGGTLTVRTALGSDELPGGWAALDDAVAFLAAPR